MKRKLSISDILVNYFLLIVLVIVTIIFAVVGGKGFLSKTILINILRSTSTLGVVGVGLTVIWGAGEMDFSIGTECTAGAVICGMLLLNPSFNSYPLAVLCSVVLVGMMGFCNAMLTLKLHIPSFIATLGMSTIVGGFLKLWTNNSVIYSKKWPDAFTAFTKNSFLGVPVIFWLFIIISVAGWIFLEKTRTGRYIGSVGINGTACKQVGISVDKVKTIAFVVCAVIVSFGGIMYASVVNSVSPSSGVNVLDGICIVLMGATFIKGGQANILGTMIAALLMAILSNGLTFLGMPEYAKDILQGIIIAIAVSAIAIKKKGSLPTVSFG